MSEREEYTPTMDDLVDGYAYCTGIGPVISDMRRVRSYSEAFKGFSPRTYSYKEVAAGRRLGLANGSAIKGTAGGSLFWATGPWAANEVKRLRRKATQTLADTEIVAAAIDREWDRPWDDEEATS